MKVTLTTAVELNAKQKEAMEVALSQRLNDKELTFSYIIDPNVLGGIKLMVGSRELDGTLRARINQISDRLSTQL